MNILHFQKNGVYLSSNRLDNCIRRETMANKVTIYDVAAAAEVSACSVSWVLNDHPRGKGIKAETRTRILDTAAELGYRRNQLASATRTGKINTIGLLVDFEDIHYITPITQIISGIITEASARCYSVKIFANKDLETSFRLIGENCISKVISLSAPHEIREKTAILAEKYSLDLVFAFEHGHRNFPAVNVDNIAMTSSIVQYLFEKGHRRIGFLGVPHTFHYVSDRRTGYFQGMKKCNLTTDPRWISDYGDTEDGIKNILALPEAERPTAVVTVADSIAAKAQKFAWRKGLRIPEDFSVTGIGNMDIARYTLVTLTTVEEFLPDYGSLLIKLVLKERMETIPDEHNVYHIRPEIIERESVYNLNNI